MDLMDLGRSRDGNRYALTVIDSFTKLGGAYPLKDKKADTVARVFMERWALEGGRVPKVIQSDNGSEFINEVMKTIVDLFLMERRTSLAYHSRANGVTERFNRTIQDILRKLVSDEGEWDLALPYATYAYNNSPHEATGESPFYVAYGRDEPMPVGGVPVKESKYVYSVDEYKEQLTRMMGRVKEVVKGRLERDRELMKERYDRKYEQNRKRLPVPGDRVYMKVETEKGASANPKLVVEWRGPYRVLEVGETTAKIKAIHDEELRVVQFDLLRMVPVEADNREVTTRTGLGKGKRGRPRKVQEAQRSENKLGSTSAKGDERDSVKQRKAKAVYSKDKDVIENSKKREEKSSLEGPRWRKGEAC